MKISESAMPVSSLTSAKPPGPANTHVRKRFVASPGVIAIGASTGGPQALVALLSAMATVLDRLSICVTLHMPRDLMPIIAAHIARTCGVATCIVTERVKFEVGTVYFAPGDRHITLRHAGAAVEIDLTPEKPSNFCKPAVDVMFAAAARVYGARTVGIVLSGMGSDGLDGAIEIAAAGGTILAQDKASSAVWGMPGAVTNANITSAILKPNDLGKEIIRRLAYVGTIL